MNVRQSMSLLLADDDKDDCMIFKEALAELPISVQLTTANDGEQLMKLLTSTPNELPHALFLDLNMPRKNGFECLTEIKKNEKLKELAVIIFSTSFQQDVADLLYINGAQYFIRKPANFEELKKVIHQVIRVMEKNLDTVGKLKSLVQPAKEDFVIV